MKRKKLLAVLLASAMTISMAACGNDSAESSTPSESTGTESTESSAASEEVSSETPAGEPEQEAVVAELKPLANKEYGTDYVSLYSQFGKETSIADVIEDEETGFAYIERDGVRYQLGLDFLSMAMVYSRVWLNIPPIPTGDRRWL
nr:hypothetical protein [uncultured Acetatifactor sp.]